MKLKLAQRMQKARKRELDLARANLAKIDTKIRDLEHQLEQAHNKVRALHASPQIKGPELELAHLRCKQLEQELQHQSTFRQAAQATLVTKYHHKERGDKVLDRVTTAHKEEQIKQEQRCNDDRSPDHLKKLA